MAMLLLASLRVYIKRCVGEKRALRLSALYMDRAVPKRALSLLSRYWITGSVT